jgi:hypothetical protein
MKPIGKIILYRFTLSIISTACFIFLLEIVFRIHGYIYGIDYRLYAKELKNSNRVPKEITGYPLNNPNGQGIATTSDFSVYYSINSRGLRDKEYPYVKTKGVFRIEVFGDSFTFGEGIPIGKRFSDILNNNLRNTEVINFGFPGAPLDRIFLDVISEGYKYNPDCILLVLNNLVTDRGSSDLNYLYESTNSAEIHSLIESNIADRKTIYLSRSDPFFEYKPLLFLRYSYAMSYLYYRYSILKLHNIMQNNDRVKWGNYTQGLKDEAGNDFLHDIDIADRTIKILTVMNEFCRNNNIIFVVVNIDGTKLKHFYKSSPPFVYFDLSDLLQREEKKYNLTFKYDQHYNEKTNYIIGSTLTQLLKYKLGNK